MKYLAMKYLAASLGTIGLGVFLIYTAVSSWNSGVLSGTGKVGHSVTSYADKPILFVILTGFFGACGTFLIAFVLVKAALDDKRSKKLISSFVSYRPKADLLPLHTCSAARCITSGYRVLKHR